MKPIKLIIALSLFTAALYAESSFANARTGGRQADAIESYVSTLKNHTLKHISYPRRALERNWEGDVLLRITIDAEGQVQNIEIVEESRYSNLNREALRSVERANPYPPIPANLGQDTLEFTAPITFRLSG
ncbi:energy transducer TonB [Microbulbifer sp.]|uniref:energy transducer TonB n=1 Tax=Microbulbifer sp. TaxID=1908541 RepID=UPI003F39A893